MVGTSGWSYPSWRPGFYPAGTKPGEFLGHYATRFRTVELNTTGYRMPAEDQFGRWADADARRLSVRAEARRAPAARPAAAFEERSRAARRPARADPRRRDSSARDEGLLALRPRLVRPRAASSRSTSGTSRGTGSSCRTNAVRVGSLEGDAAFRYLRASATRRTTRQALAEQRAGRRRPARRRHRDLLLLPPRGRADGADVRGAAARAGLGVFKESERRGYAGFSASDIDGGKGSWQN